MIPQRRFLRGRETSAGYAVRTQLAPPSYRNFYDIMMKQAAESDDAFSETGQQVHETRRRTRREWLRTVKNGWLLRETVAIMKISAPMVSHNFCLFKILSPFVIKIYASLYKCR